MQKIIHNKKSLAGFTITEILIAMAIGTLMLLIVFLAVPQAARNSRNSAVTDDAVSLINAAKEFKSINNGRLPGYASPGSGPDILFNGQAGTTSVGAKVRANTRVSIAPTVGCQVLTSGGFGTSDTVFNVIKLYTGCECNPIGNGAIDHKGKIAALFKIETSGTDQAVQCLDG
jgi:type II secretory pathway pseudopilin PulG